MYIYRTVVQVAFLGVPLVILCYCLVNLSFFAVLSYEQIESAEAVGLVCVAMHISMPHINIEFFICGMNMSGIW